MIADEIKKAEAEGISLTQIARESGRNHSTIYRIRNGETSATETTIEAIRDAIGRIKAKMRKEHPRKSNDSAQSAA